MQSAFFRKTALDRAGLLSNPWMPKLCEDFLFWLNLGLVTHIGYRPGAVSQYRVHTGSGTCQPALWGKIYSSKREVMERFFIRPDIPFRLRSLRNRALGGLSLSVAGMFLQHFHDVPAGLEYIRLAREEQPDAAHLHHLFDTIRLWMVPIGGYLISAMEALLAGRREEALERLQQLRVIDCWLPQINDTLHAIGADKTVEVARPATAYTMEVSPQNQQRNIDLTAVARVKGSFECSTSTPLIDIILPGPPGQPFSWGQREGWVHALIRAGMLNQVYWAWDNEKVIDQIMRALARSTADFVLVMSCDHHMPYLHDTPAKADFWRSLHLPVICHCAERILGSPFPDSKRKTFAALKVFDAFIYIDELSTPLFEASGKPSLWVPQYVDEMLFRGNIPFDRRTNRIFFRGQLGDYGLPGVYQARIRLLQQLKGSPVFELSEAYRPLLTPAKAAEMKAGYRFVLSAPANCTGYSSSLYEALACGCAVFQYALSPSEVKSNSLFVPGRHFISYEANSPVELTAAAAHACNNWSDYAGVAREGMEECLAKHTISIRLREVIDFVARNWSLVSRKPSCTKTASGIRPSKQDRQKDAGVRESGKAILPECVADALPVHFFTIVLNGEPFIRRHIDVFKRLPFNWHWHIIEGVADLKNDTEWCRANGGRITPEMHMHGLSNDGTTAYLDSLAREFPNITVYRKEDGQFWDGKLEMVNAPLPSIKKECLLWQVDVDEFWTSDQIANTRSMFQDHPEKTAAYYACRFFVGPELLVTSRDTYGNQTRYEWLRTWRYKPSDRWFSHEPPRLCRRNAMGQWADLSRMDPFLHAETEARKLVFDHYAYVTEQQLRFKELYYGYRGAVSTWRSLQANRAFPCLLKNFFPWVKDDAVVDRLRQPCPPPSLRPIKRILWVRTDSIGDNVLSACMLPHIHEKYPEAEITVICQEHVKPLFEANPWVGKIISINKRKAYRDTPYLACLADQLADGKFDLALNSVYSREPISDFLTFASKASEMVGFEGDLCNIHREERDRNNRHYTLLIPGAVLENEIQRHREFLEAIDIRPSMLKPEVWLTREDEQVADAFWSEQRIDSARVIGLFIGAQDPVRTCPSFGKALSNVCNQHEFHVIAFGAVKDYWLAQRTLESIGGRVTNLCGRTSLRQTAALLKRCRIGVGVETGTAHMACAVGTSNVVLVGGGHFGRFLPYSPLTSLVCLPLDCFGCNWRCRYSTPHCTRDIVPRALAEAIGVDLREPSTTPRLFLQNPADWIPSADEPFWRWPIPNLPLRGVEVRISDAGLAECGPALSFVQHV
jgi:ADP-heptose:LPS heptosyltransferase